MSTTHLLTLLSVALLMPQEPVNETRDQSAERLELM
jgi:hypothetical protein